MARSAARKILQQTDDFPRLQKQNRPKPRATVVLELSRFKCHVGGGMSRLGSELTKVEVEQTCHGGQKHYKKPRVLPGPALVFFLMDSAAALRKCKALAVQSRHYENKVASCGHALCACAFRWQNRSANLSHFNRQRAAFNRVLFLQRLARFVPRIHPAVFSVRLSRSRLSRSSFCSSSLFISRINSIKRSESCSTAA